MRVSRPALGLALTGLVAGVAVIGLAVTGPTATGPTTLTAATHTPPPGAAGRTAPTAARTGLTRATSDTPLPTAAHTPLAVAGRTSPTSAAVRTTPPVTIALPPVNGQFDYQIGGAYPPKATVAIVDRDRGDSPAAGKYSICYVNAFQTQAEEAGFWTGSHTTLLLRNSKGAYLQDPGWPGEYILDTSTAAKRRSIAGIVDGWIDGCRAKGFQGIEPDNLDSWTRSKGRLTQADNVALASLLATHAHADGLAIAQKNTTQLGSTGKTIVGFDFAIAEECQVYDECGSYTKPYGNHVIEIEYTDNPRGAYTKACAAQGKHISVILRDRDVVPAGQKAYRYQYC